MIETSNQMTCDVLVIGSGGAGIKAAITAADAGASVLLVSKQAFGRTGATFYPGTPGWGMQAVLHEGDSPEFFLEEILEAGAGMASLALASVLAEQCTTAFHELEAYGLRFNQDEAGRYKSVIPCFGKRLRGSTTFGIDTIRGVLWNQLEKRAVTVRSGVTVISLTIRDGQVCGALAVDRDHVPFSICAKAVVLATGGACGLYRHALATPDVIGDGYVLALDAGAALVNIEFIQFIPGIVWPARKKLFQEKNLDTFPTMTNRLGEDIVRKYLPSAWTVEECLIERAKHGPFTTDDISFYVDVGLYEEALNGNAMPSGGIHIQYDRKVLTDPRWTITSWLDWMHGMGVRPVEQGFDMIPHAQCFNGGIAIDTRTSAGIAGLYAAGEAAGGPHGANRLGGAAIAATQVFGAIAGRESASFASKQTNHKPVIIRLDDALDRRFQGFGCGDLDVAEAGDAIRDILWHSAAIVRSAERCRRGLDRLADIVRSFDPWRRIEGGSPVGEVVGLVNSLRLAEVMLTVIDARRESRGPHYRQDYPQRQKAFAAPFQVRWQPGGSSLTDPQFLP